MERGRVERITINWIGAAQDLDPATEIGCRNSHLTLCLAPRLSNPTFSTSPYPFN